jgi:hypothetical protein
MNQKKRRAVDRVVERRPNGKVKVAPKNREELRRALMRILGGIFSKNERKRAQFSF